jgi:cytochrome d ubiquinol oxidase subunit II
MGIDLPLIWAIIILFGVMMYVVMDGFDLGIGILFMAVKEEENRDAMMTSVAPVWDGNETWLVLGGAGLLVAFPVAYAVILSALYLPLIFMLIGLIFRGVAFEFRFKASPERRHFWDKSFIGGSLVAAFFQGVTLGSFVEGIPVKNEIFAGDSLAWLTPFPLFVGAGLVVAYALLGSTWLVMKTGGLLHERMRRASVRLALALVAVIAVISVWTPLAQPLIRERWFTMPNILWFAPVPLLVLAVSFALRWSLRRGGPDALPFVLTLALIFLGYTGLGISVWPHVIPPTTTIWDAAGPPQSLGFALVGALFIIPLILMYTAWSYYVFRGKVKLGEGYH